jgi:hypothetical protein
VSPNTKDATSAAVSANLARYLAEMWRSALPLGGIITFFGAVDFPPFGVKTAE